MFRCRFLRLHQDRTSRELARTARIDRAVLSNIERGWMNLSANELKRIADALKFNGDPIRLLGSSAGQRHDRHPLWGNADKVNPIPG
jgi:transcriptional regulator with XRE-family HTH domain